MKTNNHFVPRVYLSQWATENRIYEYFLYVPKLECPKWNRRSVLATSNIDSFYIQEINYAVDDSMEDLFSKYVESKYRKLIEKVENEQELGENDYEYINRLFLSQYLRTPKGYKNFMPIAESAFHETIDIVNENMVGLFNTFYKDFESARMKGEDKESNVDLFPLKSKIQKDAVGNSVFEVETVVGKTVWLKYIKGYLEGTDTRVRDISWGVYTAPKYKTWLTSDHPAVAVGIFPNNQVRFEVGITQKNVNLILPLTPTKLLFAQIGHKHKNTYNQADGIFFYKLQDLIIANAYMKIYSIAEDKYVSRKRRTVIDEVEFQRLTSEYREFHENYLKNEVPFLNSILQRGK